MEYGYDFISIRLKVPLNGWDRNIPRPMAWLRAPGASIRDFLGMYHADHMRLQKMTYNFMYVPI